MFDEYAKHPELGQSEASFVTSEIMGNKKPAIHKCTAG
ncbi:MAG: hypothetical protein ACI85N_001507 [Gammaproteobacteria bacterium]|jgi:hypothetical protein